MRALITAALNHSRTVLSVLMLLLISGIYAYVTIPKESDPDINIPVVYVSMSYEGISPEDAERLLVRPVEQEVRSIEGIKELTATAYQGGANVVLEFEAGFDSDKALDDVRQKVDDARPDLPDGVDEPTVHEVNFSLFPVLVVTLAGDIPERSLLSMARDLQDELEAIPTILEANIAGDREELLEIVIDPLRLESYNLDVNEVVSLISRSNRLIAAGNLDTGQGRFAIKVPGLFETAKDVWDMPIKTNGDAVVRFSDIGMIRRTFKDPESFARVDGKNAIAIEVVKRTGENIIETIDAVKATVSEAKTTWPNSIEISYSQDRSEDILDMLRDLQNNVISAVLLVMIVCIAALGFRSAALVGIAIPGSFLTGILVIYLMGLTVNIVVLFSLILAVGMLVDGAIVVTEYADRKMAEGVHRREAYRLASIRMAWPIIASTATTLAAFMPLLFWPGVVGQFMSYLPVTLLATLSASLIMALIFVPTIGAHFGKAGNADHETMHAIAHADEAGLLKLKGPTGWYVRALSAVISHPAKILLLAFLTLIGVQTYYKHFGHGTEFFPSVEPKIASVLVHARGNLSIYENDALVKEVEKRILELDEFDSVYARTGTASGGISIGGEMAPDVIGQITLEFKDWQERRPAFEILQDIRDRTSDIAGIYVEPREQEEGPPSGKAVQIQLSSRHPELLPDARLHIYKGLEEVGGMVDYEDDAPLPGIEWKIDIDRAQALKFGVDLLTVGESIRMITNGLQLGTYRPNDTDDEIDIVIRYPVEYRNLLQLDQIRIPSTNGNVPISNFITKTPQQKTGDISRASAMRTTTVKADVPEGTLPSTKILAMQQWLEENPLDKGVQYTFKGEDEDQKESQEFLMKAFIVALFVMAIILVTQFNSFYSALLILSAVIMSTIGVMLGLLILGSPFGVVMSGIGVIALAGIVVNNNIVLIDTYDRLLEDTKNPRLALLRTGAQRLRPVMLTTVTTILGLIPMAMQLNIDFITREVTLGAPSTQWWTQLANAIVFGLAFATILTLMVTPAALMVRANVQAWRKKRRAAKQPPVTAPISNERAKNTP